MKIGLISDTHLAGSGRGLPDAALRALQGVDLVLHCGDLECLGVLDHLETVAPVLAVRGYEDPMEQGKHGEHGDRLANTTRVVTVEGVAIGMVHDIQWPPPRITTNADATSLTFPPGPGRELMARKFGRPVDVVVFGDTHQELVCWYDGVLLVNPGSPNYPAGRRRGGLGTIGLLEVDHGLVRVRLVDLADQP